MSHLFNECFDHLTHDQILSICHIHDWHKVEQPLDEFLLSVQPLLGHGIDGGVMVKAGSIWIGVEPDGSRHS